MHKKPRTILQRKKKTIRKKSPIKVGLRRFLKQENLPTGKTIVIISPHPDDVSISCGATVKMLVERKNNVIIVSVTSGNLAKVGNLTPKQVAKLRKKEAEKEAKILGSKLHFLGFDELGGRQTYGQVEQKFIELMKKLNPDIIFSPHAFAEEFDHPDHYRTNQLNQQALISLLQPGKSIELWNYESPWASLSKINTFVLLEKKAHKAKIKGIKAHKSQTQRTPFVQISKAMAKMRAIAAGEFHAGLGEKAIPYKKAEAFFVQKVTKKGKQLQFQTK